MIRGARGSRAEIVRTLAREPGTPRTCVFLLGLARFCPFRMALVHQPRFRYKVVPIGGLTMSLVKDVRTIGPLADHNGPTGSKNDLTTASYWDQFEVFGPVVSDTWYRKLARRHFDRLLRGILYETPKPPDVLELGCAPGRMLCRMHGIRPDCRFVGVDFAPHGVQATKRVMQERGIEAPILEGDVRSVELPQKFDVVVSFGLIEHFNDPSSILRHHARFCRPGGVVAVTVPNFSPWLIQRLAYWSAPNVAAKHNFQIMSKRMMESAMNAAGLQGVQVGAFGGPRVWNATDRMHWTSWMYRRAARIWNFAASLVPGNVLWQGTYWAKGVLPR